MAKWLIIDNKTIVNLENIVSIQILNDYSVYDTLVIQLLPRTKKKNHDIRMMSKEDDSELVTIIKQISEFLDSNESTMQLETSCAIYNSIKEEYFE